MRLLSLVAALIAMVAFAGVATAQDSDRPGPPGFSDSGGHDRRRGRPDEGPPA